MILLKAANSFDFFQRKIIFNLGLSKVKSIIQECASILLSPIAKAFKILNNNIVYPSLEHLDNLILKIRLLSKNDPLSNQASKIKKVASKVFELMTKKKIFWTPHPYFVYENDKFQFDQVNLADPRLYGITGLAKVFHDESNENIPFKNLNINSFLKWLNEFSNIRKYLLMQKNPIDDLNTQNEQFFMNCVDFIYYTLHSLNLISKKEILNIYKKYSSFEVKDRYYGFKLDAFQDIDKNIKENDIILCFDKKNHPLHILFYTKNNKTISLWNSITDFSIKEISFEEIEKHSSLRGEKVHFKYCPIEKALSDIKSSI
ncbi:MAG: hypothetical protein K1060chlam5_00116 [Candidatus Anoxychlamydiales bacterium]|nr:hypothetical protein [Candidatus Anoxychlamydiales bacterium]